MRLVGYIRVSTDEQNPDLQRRAVTGYAATKDTVVQRLYEDLGISGAEERRPGLDALWKDAHAGLFDTVVVWKFDRLSRSTMQLLESMRLFRQLTIDFVSLTEGVDTTTPAGRLVFTVIAGLAEFERDITIERIRAGIDAYRETHHGRWGKAARPVDTERLRALIAARTPLREMARELGVPRTTLRRLVERLAGP